MITKEQIIAECLERFNFTKVQHVMEFLNWKCYINNEFKIPSIQNLMTLSEQLISEAYDICIKHKDYAVVSTAGLSVHTYYDKEHDVVWDISLSFELEKCDIEIAVNDDGNEILL